MKKIKRHFMVSIIKFTMEDGGTFELYYDGSPTQKRIMDGLKKVNIKPSMVQGYKIVRQQVLTFEQDLFDFMNNEQTKIKTN